MERAYQEQIMKQNDAAAAYVQRPPEQRTASPDPSIATRERRARRRAWAYEQARRARSGLLTMMFVADWAIRQAARTEPNRQIRRQRQHILSDTWRRFSGRLIRQTGRL